MTNERMLYLIDKAIGNLKDREDGYGTTPIDFMRKNGIKSTENMSIFLDSVGAYLEELRCGILGDIEADAAKKNGKSKILSNVKKFGKLCAKHREIKPRLGWANYDEIYNKYVLLDGCAMLIADNSDGMELCPERVVKDTTMFAWKKCVPDTYGYKKQTLPSVGKIAAYRKEAKAKAGKSKEWDKLYFADFGIKGEYLEIFMNITGATEILYKDNCHAMYMSGNGYEAVIMPIKKNPETEPTVFE